MLECLLNSVHYSVGVELQTLNIIYVQLVIKLNIYQLCLPVVEKRSLHIV